MDFDRAAVAEYVRKAETADLLDRVTVYRSGMEPAALDLMNAELAARGVGPAAIFDHYTARRASAVLLPDGTAERCTYCDRPAVVRKPGWHRLFGKVPVFPRTLALCPDHAPPPPEPEVSEDADGGAE